MSDYRKLRTIYDALDAHNFKQSLKLCDAALKKAADTSMVKALKAVTLERMGRTEEGLKLARDVASALAPPADDHLLSTLNIVFKATGHSAEGAAAYASAFEQEPKNEELGASLFGAWLREREYAKAQQLMMKMCAARNSSAQFRRAIRRAMRRRPIHTPPRRYKTFAADKYMFSAVTCLLLQLPPDGRPGLGWALHSSSAAAPAAAADGAASKQLQLAAAMMQRALTQGKVTKESQLRLHLEILRRQRAASAALELLREHGGLLGMAEEKQRAQAELHEQLGQFSEAADLHAAMLTEDADDWAAHRGRLRCVVRADLDDAERRAAADAVAAALTELEEKNPRRRGPSPRAHQPRRRRCRRRRTRRRRRRGRWRQRCARRVARRIL